MIGTFAADLLTDLGAPESRRTMMYIDLWAGSLVMPAGYHNPLSAFEPAPGSHVVAGDGTRAYQSYSDGLAATVTQLRTPRYATILDALMTGRPAVDLWETIHRSKWLPSKSNDHYPVQLLAEAYPDDPQLQAYSKQGLVGAGGSGTITDPLAASQQLAVVTRGAAVALDALAYVTETQRQEYIRHG